MGIKVTLPLVEKIQLKAKEGKVIIQFETVLSPGDFARVLNLTRSGCPVQAAIESPQAEMDLKFEEINVRTGELAMKI